MESICCGCIPLIGNSDLHIDCPGIQFDVNNIDKVKNIIDNDFYLFNSIEDSIKFLLCDMRKNYVYSKIFDTITLKVN